MATRADDKRGSRWRIIGWGTAVALIAAPFVAMQLTKEVNWTASDFIFAGVLIGGVGLALELAVRFTRNSTYRGGVALALAGTLLTIWANLAVGIVGSEDNPANLLFFVALLVGMVGAAIARFRAAGMAIAMFAAAAALIAAFGIALLGPTDEPMVSHVVEFAGTSLFAAFFLGSALLFRKAAR